ncbi:MAG: hypothetical protein GY944_24465 [bacterium]|nr:hypothetical protein [bacterium]
MLDGSEQLRARDSGLTAELYATTAFDAGDIGKCVLTVFTRDNTEGGQLYLWSDAIAAAALQQTTTAASPTVTAAAEMAIGAKRGDTGADEAEGLGIVGVAYGTTWLSQAAATTYMAQCVAELTVSATLPGVVGCWQAATDHADSLGRDVVGAEHFTKKEETPGDLDADQFFVPDWIDLPSSFGPSFGSSFGI